MFFEKLKEKVKEENILPILLFIVVLVNYLPIIALNFTTKMSRAIGIVPMAISLFIECIILIAYYYKKIQIKKEMCYNFLVLLVITVIFLIIQVINFFNNQLKILDLANIICKFINIFLFYILIMGVNVEEKYISNFMKAIVFMGIIACVQNIILYYDDILGHLGLVELNKGLYACKSFFPQKNPFAFFLYVSIISTIFLLQKDYKTMYKIFLSGALILFLFNLILTFSRTGTVITILFIVLYFLATNKISKKTKIVAIILSSAITIIVICLLEQYNSGLLQRILRTETIKNFTGRTEFWDLSKEMLSESPINMLFGVGRFRATTLIEKYGVTQFHNTYVEFLVSGGILELIYCMSFYIIVLIKIIKSKMDRKYKSIYILMILTFFMYMLFESLGRFSIGWSDTICMIFFITIPLLHSNSSNEIKRLSEGK